MGFQELAARAYQSDDLTLRLESACDADLLIALGWAARRHPLGAALSRLYLGDGQVDVSTAVREARVEAERIRRRWRLSKGDRFWDRFAAAGVRHWLDPVCRSCAGRRFDVAEGTGRLLAHACAACRGSGKQRYPKVGGESLDGDRWRDRFSELITHLDTEVETALNAARKMLTRKEKTGTLPGNNNNNPGVVALPSRAGRPFLYRNPLPDDDFEFGAARIAASA